MLVEKQYGTGEGREVKVPPSVGGLALPWRKLSHTVSLASLSSEHTQGCEEILWVQESN